MFGNFSALSSLEVDKNDGKAIKEINDIKKELKETISSHKEFNDQREELFLQRFDSSQTFESEKLVLNIK